MCTIHGYNDYIHGDIIIPCIMHIKHGCALYMAKYSKCKDKPSSQIGRLNVISVLSKSDLWIPHMYSHSRSPTPKQTKTEWRATQ